jgi:hypothetical protein
MLTSLSCRRNSSTWLKRPPRNERMGISRPFGSRCGAPVQPKDQRIISCVPRH